MTLADSGVKKALTKGAEEAEAFVSYADIISIILNKNIVEARQGAPCGLGVRIVADGKVGFAATSGIDEAQMLQTVGEATEVARIRPPDPDFKHLPDHITRSSRTGIIDDHVIGFSEKDALNGVKTIAETAFEHHKQIKSLMAFMEVGRTCFAIANSRGVADSTKGAYLYVSIDCIAVNNGKQKSASEFLVSRTLEDFSEIGKKAADHAVKMLESKPLGKSARTTTVWKNVAIEELLKNMLQTASNARNVQEGKSYFKGKTNEKVASDTVTIVDDGQLPEGLATHKIDAEGVPMRTTIIIENGILKSYLYDNYSALREDKQSSGNAKRDWPEPFIQTPTASTTNLIVKPGRKKLEELIATVDEGVLITDNVMGALHANTITGDFSVVAPNAFLIKKGEVKNPLEPITIAGNFFLALKKVRETGSDTRLLESGKIPSITIEDLTVSG
jgi:PmbA protein